jgi:hypothetical protein
VLRIKAASRCLASLCSLATVCVAAPITYFFSGTGSGAIGARQFSNAAYVIALAGDTSAIDKTWASLAEWRNAVKGTIQVANVGKATITEAILITTACGTTMGYVGIEKVPGGAPFVSYIYNTQGVPFPDCFLGPAAATTGHPATITAFTNVASTKGPITLTSSSLVTYQATACAKKTRSCRQQVAKTRRTILQTPAD